MWTLSSPSSKDVLGSSSFRELMRENTTQHVRVKIGAFPDTPGELKLKVDALDVADIPVYSRRFRDKTHPAAKVPTLS